MFLSKDIIKRYMVVMNNEEYFLEVFLDKNGVALDIKSS
jgi:hypothetical protein